MKPLTNVELEALMGSVHALMRSGFNQAQAFQIAASRMGVTARITADTFGSLLGRYGAQNWTGAGPLPTRSAAIQALAPGVAGGAAWLRFQAQLAGARILGRLAPRAGAVVLGAGAFSLPGILAGLAVAGALGGGIYMATNWGKADGAPVVAGERLAHAYVPIRARAAGTGGRGILSVRTRGALERGVKLSSFRHGGIGTAQAAIERLGQPMTREEATAVIARMIQKGSLHRPPLAGGMVGTVGGAAVTIDDWGDIDWKLLRELTR